MNKTVFILLVLGMCTWLPSCKPDAAENSGELTREINSSQKQDITFSSPEKLITYVNSAENGYYKEKEIDGVKFSALLKPIDYIRANEALKGDSSTVAADDDLQYFDFRITIKDFNMEFLKYNLPSAGDYGYRVAYCAYEMQKDIFLIDGKDTLPCVFYHFERTYNVVPFGHFLLAFKPAGKDAVRPKTLMYYDRLFDKGLIKMTFLPNDLIKVPKLINT
jgi:hypothetical protein